ncbi:MAG: threonine/serine exporter ThrE family protein [Thermoanaerobaculia bacterium]
MTESSEPGSRTAEVALLIRLGRDLHEAGLAAPQLETALARVASRLGIVAQFFSTPTSLFIAFGDGAGQRTHLERVSPGAIDLGRLAELEALLDRLAGGELTPTAAATELDELARRSRRYPRWLTGVCWAFASATAAVFLGGAAREVVVAGAIGLLTGVIAWLADRRPSAKRLFEPFAAALAAFGVATIAHAFPPVSAYIATVAGLIVLLPGYTLTTALSELATQHLSSGTSRFAGALVSFLMLGLGVAVGGRIAEALWGGVPGVVPIGPATWLQVVALLLAPVSLAVILKAPATEMPWIAIVGAIGYFGGRLGVEAFEPAVGMFGGALAVGLASAGYSRLRRRPSSVTLVPGILMLVPGSIGYRSLTALLAEEVVPGIETAFKMLLVAASLVAGLLVASAITVERRDRSAPPQST